MEDILFELVDCEDRKARKKLVKRALELLEAQQVQAKEQKQQQQEEEKPAAATQVEEEVAEDSPVKEKKSKKSKKEKERVEEPAPEPSSSSKKDKKKRNLEEAEATDISATNAENADESYYEDGNYPQSSEKKRFVRLDEEKCFEQALIKDNTYDAVFAGTGYGAKANEKLKTVRGDRFRHEKTKKKRGSYRGGAIDDEVVNSVEFSD